MIFATRRLTLNGATNIRHAIASNLTTAFIALCLDTLLAANVSTRAQSSRRNHHPETDERNMIGIGHMGDRGALVVDHVGLEGIEYPGAEIGIVHESRARNSATADDDPRLVTDADTLVAASLQFDTCRHRAGRLQHGRVDVEPEDLLRVTLARMSN